MEIDSRPSGPTLDLHTDAIILRQGPAAVCSTYLTPTPTPTATSLSISIVTPTEAGQELAKDDLIFLYEIDSKIEGFGYQKDPRIEEIRKQRDPLKDAPIVFDCRLDQIAHNQSEINKNTKAYIGELYSGIFDQLKDVEHIYTSFPEGKIVQKEITIGGKTAKELAKEIKEKGIKYQTILKKS